MRFPITPIAMRFALALIFTEAAQAQPPESKATVIADAAYPVCTEGNPRRGRTDCQLMATHGTCRLTDIRHFALLTAESWDRLSWRSAGDHCGFEYVNSGMYPDNRNAAKWPTYGIRLEILVDGKPQRITPGDIAQQLDCRRTEGESESVGFRRLDMMVATLQWASAWRCTNKTDRPVDMEFRLTFSDDAGKSPKPEAGTDRHVLLKDDFVAHLVSFDRKPEIRSADKGILLVWKEKVAPGKASAVCLGFRPDWSEAHENGSPLRNIGRRFTTARWDSRELAVCRQGEWRAAMDLLGAPGAELNWDDLARIAAIKERRLLDAMPRLTGFPADHTGVWEYTFDLLRAGTKPQGGLLTDVWLAADPVFYNWSFYWDTAGALHTYCHYLPDIASRTMRTYMRSAILDDGSSVMMVSPNSTHMNTPQLLNIPMALWDCYRVSRDKSHLEEAYPMLERHQDWLDNTFNRVKDDTVADIGFNIDYGSELHKERHVWVDMSMFQVNQYETLAKMAELLGRDRATVDKWRAKAAKLKDGINARMWNETDGAYYALKSRNLEQTKVACPIELNALTADVASRDQAKRLVRRFMNPDKYAPGKHGGFFCPSVAYDDPSFKIVDGWGGPIWLIEPYYVVRGMTRYGFQNEAATISENLYGMVAAEYRRTGTIWEQYRPDNGQCLNPGRRFFTSGITTSILDLFLLGQFGFERTDDPHAFHLSPTPVSDKPQGVTNLPLAGSVRLDIDFRKSAKGVVCRVKFIGLNPSLKTVTVTKINLETGARETGTPLELDADGLVETTLERADGVRHLWTLR